MSALPRRQEGLVLVVVIFFVALLMASVATFLRRATVDAAIAHNRERVARAEALARGGVRLAEALLIEDLRLEREQGFSSESLRDGWARTEDLALSLPADASLRLRIQDSGSRLNLNSLFVNGKPRKPERTEPFLVETFRKVIDDMRVRPEEKNFDPVELARNLIDWVDKDPDRVRGGAEDDVYQRRRPPYKAANRPLLSVDELRLVDGFNGVLVEALRPYVEVFPLVPAREGGGINPNTAPPWVLALMYHGSAVGEYRLFGEDEVRDILKDRAEALLCPDGVVHEDCVSLRDTLHGEEPAFFPEITFSTDVFRVVAVAQVGDVARRIETVIDRGLPSQPIRLSWRSE